MAVPGSRPNQEEFANSVAAIESGGGYSRPEAYALGLATLDRESGDVLAVRYTSRQYGENHDVAAVIADCLGQADTGLQTGTYRLDGIGADSVYGIRDSLPFSSQPHLHPIAHTIRQMQKFQTDGRGRDPYEIKNPVVPVLGAVASWEDKPETVGDAYLRLYALSERAKLPNTINLDGIFGVLPNVVVTEAAGVFTPEGWEAVAERAAYREVPTAVRHQDKIPYLLDHVTLPKSVRVAAGNRTRLGAHLADGTTVMQEGFVNFNAGTLGESMVEGRISQGVVVGEGTDIGGGASIMGTLSGGGNEVISIGKKCLLGANSGLGISLGDNCVIEAGLYVTAGTKVVTPTAAEVKAVKLSGQDNMLFRRNSLGGVVEVVTRDGSSWGGLNPELHQS